MTGSGGQTAGAEERPIIRQAVVVEGRDDQAALSRAVDCYSIATHGFGIRKETLELIRKAFDERGIIIFTDPDFSGEKIRERLTGLFPGALQAWLTRSEAEKDGDIGIENASPEDIRAALFKALEGTEKAAEDLTEPVTGGDLYDLGLSGGEDSMRRREEAGRLLGIGGGNTGSFLKKLKHFGIGRKELEEACLRSRDPKR